MRTIPTSLVTVACRYCQVPTLMRAAQLCNSCYELDRQIRESPQIAAAILAEIDAETEATLARERAERMLKELDDSPELEAELSKLSGLTVSHLWMIWEDDTYSRTAYCFNPGASSDVCNRAEYGHYRREELVEWATARCAYRLTPTHGEKAA